jgi:DNA-binding NarL/FixJ family response regulator
MSRDKNKKLFKLTPYKPEMNNRLISVLHNLNLTITEFDNEVGLSIRIRKNQLPDFVRHLANLYVTVCSAQNKSEEVRKTKCESAESFDDPKPVFWIDEIQYLTAREVASMERLKYGRYNKWIADDLNLKECTIANNFQRIFRKLKVTNRTEALVEYQKCKSLNKQVS